MQCWLKLFFDGSCFLFWCFSKSRWWFIMKVVVLINNFFFFFFFNSYIKTLYNKNGNQTVIAASQRWGFAHCLWYISCKLNISWFSVGGTTKTFKVVISVLLETVGHFIVALQIMIWVIIFFWDYFMIKSIVSSVKYQQICEQTPQYSKWYLRIASSQPKDSWFTIVNDKEKKQIVTSKELEPPNVMTQDSRAWKAVAGLIIIFYFFFALCCSVELKWSMVKSMIW